MFLDSGGTPNLRSLRAPVPIVSSLFVLYIAFLKILYVSASELADSFLRTVPVCSGRDATTENPKRWRRRMCAAARLHGNALPSKMWIDVTRPTNHKRTRGARHWTALTTATDPRRCPTAVRV